MLRIATYYDNIIGRNDGNPLYVTNSLKKMQKQGLLEVDHLAPMENIDQFGTYDLHLWVDWGEDALLSLIPYKMVDAPHPNIYWCSDTHIQIGNNNSYPYRLQMAKKFDKVFVAQKRAVEEFKRDGVDAEWLPHAFEPQAYPKIDFASKTWDVAFVGNINSDNRIEFLDRMFREFPNFFYGQRRFEDAAEIFCKSKIVLNIAMTDDINMRVFETLGTGSFLLTNWVPTIEELFENEKHLVLYKTFDEAVEKAKYYLSHDSEREKIAQAGYEEVMKKHTIDHRVNRILDVGREIVKNGNKEIKNASI